ncbi:hypothetical protein [Psychrobacter sp.]|uniref:hypothetical protein n=1 Tax=Psychrobacter sp. TaxID=56811 RepID=UPI0025E3778E|nr:hypothetical protein [Psychrobacter sp.]
MISSKPNHKTVNAISITNFDLTSLYLLRPEIKIILTTAEQHLSEFNDDTDQAPLLLDSAAMLKQLAAVLDLISLDGSSDLAYALSGGMQYLYDKADSGDDNLIISLAQGIMTLSRYIEFVLLQETVEPRLLLEVINNIHALIGKERLKSISNESYEDDDYHYVSVANPAQNFKSVESLVLDSDLLITAYRAGLAVVLAAQTSDLNDNQIKNINAMTAACAMVASQSTTLFWQAAAAVTQNVIQLLPLTESQKRLYIFIDQQLHSYLPVDDRRFADLVSFACKQRNKWADELKVKLKDNQLGLKELNALKRFLQGPDQQITSTVNTLIQQEIDSVKSEVYELVNHSHLSQTAFEANSFQPIATRLSNLASTLKVLNLEVASATLQDSVSDIKSWLAPGPIELDRLLNKLMIAENAAINLSKSYTPTAQLQQLNNANISIHQLDTAYLDLIKESRQLIINLERTISDVVDSLATAKTDDTNHTESVFEGNESFNNIPSDLKQIAGALRFLELTDAANTLNRLVSNIEKSFIITDKSRLIASKEEYQRFEKVADILLAIDHQLSCQQLGHPTVKHAVHTANRSLTELLSY